MRKIILVLLLAAAAGECYTQKQLDSLVQYSYSQGDSVRNFKQEYANYFGNDWQINISYHWDKINNEWLPTQKTQYTYVEDGKWSERYRYRWDTLVSDWIPNDYYFKVWTDFGFVLNNLIRFWNADNEQWEDSWKQENSFFDDNTRVSQISHIWNTETNEWIPEKITDYQFLPGFYIQAYVRYGWSADSSRWDLSNKAQFNYDASYNRTDAQYWNWDIENGSWVNSSKYNYDYDDFGNMTLYNYLRWNLEDETWVFTSKTRREYDENSRKVLEEYYNAESEEIPLYRYIYEFNSEGQLISQQNNRRDSDGVTIINSNLDIYNYNTDGTIITKLKHYWNKSTESWNQFITEVSYYSVLAGLDNIETTTLKIYPNPTSGLINIAGIERPSQVSIYTIQGQMIRSTTIFDSTLDVSDLDPGMYLLSIESGVKPTVRRIIIE